MRLKRFLKDHRTWMTLRLDRIADPIYGGRGSILALHRVRPAAEAAVMSFNRRLEITPDELELCIITLRDRGFDFIGADDIPARLTQRSMRRFVSVTLDDGYRDNLVHAAPIFREHRIPFTLYITNCFPDGTARMWWYLLEILLQSTDRIQVRLSTDDVDLPASSREEKEEAFSRLAPYFAFASSSEQQERLDALMSDWRDLAGSLVRDSALSWTEITDLASDKLATIGAHTMNHLALSRLPESDARREITDSRDQLRQRIGKPVSHFAYPYGGRAASGAREFTMAARAGFATAVTTRQGNLFRRHADHPTALPRLAITSDLLQHGGASLSLLTSGLIPCHENRFARVITD
jgi:peptidoglycan/xylan/chitin deacetylase (PgdA/CDA1 family)